VFFDDIRVAGQETRPIAREGSGAVRYFNFRDGFLTDQIADFLPSGTACRAPTWFDDIFYVVPNYCSAAKCCYSQGGSGDLPDHLDWDICFHAKFVSDL